MVRPCWQPSVCMNALVTDPAPAAELLAPSNAAPEIPRPALLLGALPWPAAAPTHPVAAAQWQEGQAGVARGDWWAAAQAFEAAFSADPQLAYGLHFAHALLKTGEYELARQLASALRQWRADAIGAYTLEAKALTSLGQLDQAAALLLHLPDGVVPDFDALSTLGLALERLGQRERAASAFQLAMQALQAAPPALASDAEFWLAKAIGHERCGRDDQAVQAYAHAVSIRPSDPILHYRMGKSLMRLRRKSDAAACFRQVLALGSKSQAAVRCILAMLEAEVCDWARASANLAQLCLELADVPAASAYEVSPYVLATLTSDAGLQLKAATHQAHYLRGKVPMLPAVRAQQRPGRLRLGYFSSDFRQHATTMLLVNMLEHHDRSRFEVTLLSNSRDDGSAARRRIEQACEHFEDLRGLDASQIASRIRTLGIDVLIDLKGATEESLPEVLAYRPAPLQVSWLGFPGTLGADWLDYIIGDPVVTPIEHQSDFTEKIAQMPVCYQPNDALRPLPETVPRSRWGLSDNAVVLCAFHQPFKITQAVFQTWCGILRALPQAQLWLLRWNDQIEATLTAAALGAGVQASQLRFADLVDPQTHISRLACADLFLDAWPCNAHTTAAEALWAGLPVVTLKGRTFAQRVAASLLEAVGLAEWVAVDAKGYRSRIDHLCRHAHEREAIRAHLQAQRGVSPLFDAKAFALNFEALIGRMWTRACHGLEPAPLAAASWLHETHEPEVS